MSRRDDEATSRFGWFGDWFETLLWVTAGLIGPVPWVLLATRELERVWGTTGYSIAFVGAPALWCGLAVTALLAGRRRWVVGLAILGAILWWSPFG